MSEINLTKYVTGEVEVSFDGISLVSAILFKLFPSSGSLPHSVANGSILILPLRDSKQFNYDIMVRREGPEPRVRVTIKPTSRCLYEKVCIARGFKSVVTIAYADERYAAQDLDRMFNLAFKDTLVKCVILDRASRQSPLEYITRARNVFARNEINRATAHPTVNVQLSDDPCQDGEG